MPDVAEAAASWLASVPGLAAMRAAVRPAGPVQACHGRAAAAVSREALLEAWGLRPAKYRPVTPSTSGEEARQIGVSAPWAGVFTKSRAARVTMPWYAAWSSAPNPGATTPGRATVA